VGLVEEIEAAAEAARALDGHGTLTGVLAAEPAHGVRSYVCAFEGGEGSRRWVVLDGTGRAVTDRRDARDAVAIAALCELAEEAAFPGDLDELRAQLVALRISEAPDGIEEAEAAVGDLQRTLGAPPTLATPARLDEIGAAALRLERALDPTVASPFAAAMRGAQAVVDELWREVESGYCAELSP
jgi:hypothetical protein